MRTESWRHLACFALAVAVILGGSTIFYAARESKYADYLESTQRKGLSQLMNSISSAQSALEKARYTPQGNLRMRLAAEIWKECASAEAALSALPVEGNRVERLTQYVEKTGDYAYSLFASAANGSFEEEAWQKLYALTESAASLSKTIAPLKEAGDCGVMSFQTLYSDGMERFSDGIGKINDSFPETESLSYDGIYSAEMEERKALALVGTEITPNEEMEQNAKKLLGKEAQLVGTSDGIIPCVFYSTGENSAAFCKSGGNLLSYCDGREIGESRITQEYATRCAQEFVKSIGLPEMTVTETEEQGGILSLKMACSENGLTAYPDCVRIGIAMDDGSVVRWDAAEYLIHHTSRDPADPRISLEDAQSALPDSLTATDARLTYCPTPGGSERLCWEIICENEDGTQIYLYVNADSGQVEDVQIHP